MGYSMDMNGEKAPKRKRLLPEGWRDFTIVGCHPEKSKAGNDMFVFSVTDELTGYTEDIYAIATPGKRWYLKMILAACDCSASSDGVYNWDIPDVINKRISGLVEHEPNNYIDRDGVTQNGIQHRIVEIKKRELNEAEEEWAKQEQQ
jgi:hypothetical protein